MLPNTCTLENLKAAGSEAVSVATITSKKERKFMDCDVVADCSLIKKIRKKHHAAITCPPIIIYLPELTFGLT